MRVSPKKLYQSCYSKFAIPAINVWSMEEVLALFETAQSTRTPFIVQTTPMARKYAGESMLLAMMDAAETMFPDTLFSVHLDHGNVKHALQAIQSEKYNSVMIDGSHYPIDKNIEVTNRVVKQANAMGVKVEAELGVLSGIEDNINISDDEKKYTKPEEVCQFIEKTGCKSLAVAVGTSHGAYKFKGDQGIQFEILKEIQQNVPLFPLVLHGGSAINCTEIQRINAAGGNMETGSKGVNSDELKKAIGYGICKVNIASDLRLIHTRVHREFYKNEPGLFDPVVPGKKYMEELKVLFTEKFELLGALGKNEQINI